MNIKISSYIQHYVGPSQYYYNAQNRFDEILKDKLGIANKDKVELNNEEKEDVIFLNSVSDISQNLKNESSLTKTFNKTLNSVNINGIIDTNDVRKKSNYSAEYIDSKLKGTPLEGLGEDFKKAEDIYGVNSIILMSMAKLESNFGRSKIAIDKNNLFGYQAYDSSPYKSAKEYDTKRDSIYDVAKHLSKNYLNSTGNYFNGYSVDAIGIKYSTDKNWSSKIKKIASELIR